MDPAVSERHIVNGRVHLSDQSDLICWQTQLISVELESSNSGSLSCSDSSRGISHSISVYNSLLTTPTYPQRTQQYWRRKHSHFCRSRLFVKSQLQQRISTRTCLWCQRKMGPIINLKHLNRFVKSEHFKMEGLHTVKSLLRRNDWMAKIDLKVASSWSQWPPNFGTFSYSG